MTTVTPRAYSLRGRFLDDHTPNSRHSPQLVPLSLIRSAIILATHASHSSWLLPLASRRIGSNADTCCATVKSAVLRSADCPGVNVFFSTFWFGADLAFISTYDLPSLVTTPPTPSRSHRTSLKGMARRFVLISMSTSASAWRKAPMREHGTGESCRPSRVLDSQVLYSTKKEFSGAERGVLEVMR